MPLLTLKAQIHPDPETEALLRNAMYCTTKVYNGLLWHLRKKYEETGKARGFILASIPLGMPSIN